MIIGSDFERVGYSGETKDDGFGEVPIEDDGSFVIGRNMPVDTRDLVHPNMAPRIDRTKSKVSDHLRVIREKTILIESELRSIKGITEFLVSQCNSKFSFKFMEETITLELAGWNNYTIDEMYSKRLIYNDENKEIRLYVYYSAICKAIQRMMPNCDLDTTEEFYDSSSFNEYHSHVIGLSYKHKKYLIEINQHEDSIKLSEGKTRYDFNNNNFLSNDFSLQEFFDELYENTLGI